MTSHKETRRLILRLLGSMAGEKELRLYLDRFSSVDADRFAVIKVGGALIAEQLKPLASSLAFLRQVGLTPIVVHGGGPQLNQALEAAGIENQVRDGLRVTTPEVLKVARRVFRDQNRALVGALREQGVTAVSLVGDVFEAQWLDQDRFGHVGEVTDVHVEGLRDAVRGQSIPVIAPLAESDCGQILNINADTATNALARRIQPYKIVFLTATGGMLDGEGQIIPSINLAASYERLMRQSWLHSGMKLKLEQIHSLLSELPAHSSVSITDPNHLTRELFTHRGSGTLVRMGETIDVFSDWDGIDRQRLKALFEDSFGRRLSDDWFESIDLAQAYVARSYRAAIILARDFVTRLDKFSVSAEAKGEGLGRAIWQRMLADHPQLYWRARADNPIHQFYEAECDGLVRRDAWTVYWKGVDDFDLIQRCVSAATQAPATLT